MAGSQWFRGFQKLPKKRLCASCVLSLARVGVPIQSAVADSCPLVVFLSQAPDFASTKEEPQPLCRVEAAGVYPAFCVADACSAGSASGISRLYLWRLFSLDKLNGYLERDPVPSELTYRVPTRHR